MSRCARLLALALAFAAGTCAAAVRYVDPGSPAARDLGDGGAGHPYRTLAYAMTRLEPGDTLNLAAGVYRESIVFPERAWTSAQTVVQSAPGGGEALITGSDVVTGWQKIAPGLFVKRPWPTASEQVFVDGKPLQQIGGNVFGGYPDNPDHPLHRLQLPRGGIWPGRVAGGVDQMTPDSFYYDAVTHALYLKTALESLDGHVVEASVRPYLVFGKHLQHVTLRNLRFRHSNTTAVAQNGAITLLGDHLRLERLDIAEADGAGLDVTGDDVLIRDSRASYCGQVGMKVRGRGDRLLDNVTSFNNTRGFNKWWEAGGAKFVGAGGLQDSEVTGQIAVGNNGDGIWFDWMNKNNRIHGNVVAYNSGFGIQYEASQAGYIYDNYVFGNGQRGIYLPDASRSVVAHNLVAKNGMEGIAIVDEGRASANPALVPRDNAVFGNLVAWNGKAALVLPAGGLGNASDYNLFVRAAAPSRFSLGWGSRASPVRNGLAAWQAASRQDTHSWHAPLVPPQALEYALRAARVDPPWNALTALARGKLAQPVVAPDAAPRALRVAGAVGPQSPPPAAKPEALARQGTPR
ncbi:MAG: right-handed parallel beta-helix repeat-containing protein [Betaproteobacteria bacterium]|nr:right-handed parallel beta-helix repeat-containing protein [Betaproteobacteria bacterium]